MTPEQIEIVQQTFAEVASLGERATLLFYERLFEIAPEVRPLFADDLTEQSRKLFATLRVAVIGLRDSDEIMGVLQQLGLLHAHEHRVRPEHYAPVGEALLWTLEQALGPDFTAEAREAWAETYQLIATTMIGASADVEA